MLEEYVAWIGLDLAFQGIDAELDGLPGKCAPPRGALFVADEDGRLLGTIGLRPLDERACLDGAFDAKAGEMKRLFVRPEARGRGLAKKLIAVGQAEISAPSSPQLDGASHRLR